MSRGEAPIRGEFWWTAGFISFTSMALHPRSCGGRFSGRFRQAPAPVIFPRLELWPTPGRHRSACEPLIGVRDHGGGPLVDVVENWWYGGIRAPRGRGLRPRPRPRPDPMRRRRWPGSGRVFDGREGRWDRRAAGRGRCAHLYATYLRPDPGDPKVLAAVARFDQARIRDGREPVAGSRGRSGAGNGVSG